MSGSEGVPSCEKDLEDWLPGPCDVPPWGVRLRRQAHAMDATIQAPALEHVSTMRRGSEFDPPAAEAQ